MTFYCVSLTGCAQTQSLNKPHLIITISLDYAWLLMLASLRSLHVSHSNEPIDGGIATAVASLVTAERNIGLQPTWITADCYAPYHRDRDLRAAVLSAHVDLVHVHGLWRSPTRILTGLAGADLPLLISPHGMLDSGALLISRRKKQLVWHLWEKQAIQSSRCIHALCPAEQHSISALLPESSVAVIPNGVTLPNLLDNPLSMPPWVDVIPEGAHVLLFLGRFHSKKGLDPLLKAWQAVCGVAESNNWWLALVGYGDDGALQQRVASANARGELPRVFVGGPAFSHQKAAVLQRASAFVLPSFSEGLPMAALEAMANQLPCLLSSACNLPDAFAMGAALPAEPQLQPLSSALQQLFALSPAERAALGAAGRALVAQHYSWPKVAARTRQLYEWILGGGERPWFVHQG